MKDKINNADAASFEVVDSIYSKDKNSVYYRGVKLEGIEPSTLAIFTCGYAKDASKVFRVMYDGTMTLMDVSDPSSFTMFENGCYAKDKNFVYYKGNKIDGADVVSFEIGTYGTEVRDKNTRYLSGRAVKAGELILPDGTIIPGPPPPPGIPDAIIVKPYPIGL